MFLGYIVLQLFCIYNLCYMGFWWGNLRERDHSEDLDIDGRVILKWIFKTWEGGHGLNCL